MRVTASMRERAMQSLAVMVVMDRAKREKRPAHEVFSDFRRSGTFKMLFNKDTGLWLNGPDYISEEYDLELERQKL